MKTKNLKKITRIALALSLVLFVVFANTGCSLFVPNEGTSDYATEQRDGGKLGEGDNSFVFKVTGTDGKEIEFDISTNKTIVGDALSELKLIDGDNGQYGLYVKSVNGETLDYNIDGKYWAFYINNEYAVSGVDKTEITNGAEYAFKAE